MLFELLGLGCGLGTSGASPEERRSDDPRFGGALPAVKDVASVLSPRILFEGRYGAVERVLTHQWKLGGEVVVVVVAVHVPERGWT